MSRRSRWTASALSNAYVWSSAVIRGTDIAADLTEGSSRAIADDFCADRAPVVEAVRRADLGDVVDVDGAVDQRARDRGGGDRVEARLGQLGRPVVVGDGLDDRIGQAPLPEQVGAELGVADAALLELDLEQ